ncbi:LOW QUALITY PROTEIN: hypothetical protein KUTeg_008970, partial [Tegillarca granosa]
MQFQTVCFAFKQKERFFSISGEGQGSELTCQLLVDQRLQQQQAEAPMESDQQLDREERNHKFKSFLSIPIIWGNKLGASKLKRKAEEIPLNRSGKTPRIGNCLRFRGQSLLSVTRVSKSGKVKITTVKRFGGIDKLRMPKKHEHRNKAFSKRKDTLLLKKLPLLVLNTTYRGTTFYIGDSYRFGEFSRTCKTDPELLTCFSKLRCPLRAIMNKNIAGTLVGDFLAMQLIYGGKTDMCHPKFSFPSSFDITHSENHWANAETMAEYINKIIVPYIDSVKDEKDFSIRQKSLVIFDCFRGQITDEFLSLLNKESILYATIPPKFVRISYNQWTLCRGNQNDLSLTNLKPLGARWLLKLYHFLKSNPDTIYNGFHKAGIAEA